MAKKKNPAKSRFSHLPYTLWIKLVSASSSMPPHRRHTIHCSPFPIAEMEHNTAAIRSIRGEYTLGMNVVPSPRIEQIQSPIETSTEYICSLTPSHDEGEYTFSATSSSILYCQFSSLMCTFIHLRCYGHVVHLRYDTRQRRKGLLLYLVQFLVLVNRRVCVCYWCNFGYIII